jgi:CHASE1-domain containing sensor protein
MKFLSPLALAVAGALLAAGGWVTQVVVQHRQDALNQQAEAAFQAEADRLQSSIRQRLDDALPALQALRGLVAGSDDVSAAEFDRFVALSGFDQLGDGVLGLLVQRVLTVLNHHLRDPASGSQQGAGNGQGER